jgi:hypothetical protein
MVTRARLLLSPSSGTALRILEPVEIRRLLAGGAVPVASSQSRLASLPTTRSPALRFSFSPFRDGAAIHPIDFAHALLVAAWRDPSRKSAATRAYAIAWYLRSR